MEEKAGTRKRRKYYDDFKLEIMSLLELGRSVSDLSSSFGVSQDLLTGGAGPLLR